MIITTHILDITCRSSRSWSSQVTHPPPPPSPLSPPSAVPLGRPCASKAAPTPGRQSVERTSEVLGVHYEKPWLTTFDVHETPKDGHWKTWLCENGWWTLEKMLVRLIGKGLKQRILKFDHWKKWSKKVVEANKWYKSTSSWGKLKLCDVSVV